MGYFPGKQTATPTKPKPTPVATPTPIKTNPALSDEENKRRQEYNLSIGVSDKFGRSPSDPNYGTAPKVSSEQFKTGGGAAQVSKGTVEQRNVMISNLAMQQQVSREGRSYAANAWAAVSSSPARREVKPSVGYDNYTIQGGRVTNAGPVSVMSSDSSGGFSSRSLPIYDVLTPKSDRGKVINVAPVATSNNYSFDIDKLPGYQRNILNGGYAGIKTVGYTVGEPIRVVGKNLRLLGEKAEPYQNMYQGSTLKNVGKFVESYGEGYVKEPGKSLIYAGVGYGISFVLEPIAIGVKIIGSTKTIKTVSNFIPKKVKEYTGKAVVFGAIAGYSYLTGKRILSSPTPYATAGNIFSTEITTGLAGGYLGERSLLKAQGYLRTIGIKKSIPISKLTPPEVASGRKPFPSVKPQDQPSVLAESKYTIQLNDKKYYPHASSNMFGRKFTAQEGDRLDEAAGMWFSFGGAETNFLRIQKPTTVNLYPKSLLPEATTPTLVYVNPTAIKPLPSFAKREYGKVFKGASYQFYKNQAVKGVGYAPFVKTEPEFIEPVGTLFKATGDKFKTVVQGIDVPIKLYDVKTKISTRQYFYPGQDLLNKVPSSYVPKPTYNVPGSTYLSIAATSQALNRGSSYSITPGSSAVIPSSYTPSPITSSFSYKPSLSKVGVSYSFKAPSSVSKVLKYSGGSGGSGGISLTSLTGTSQGRTGVSRVALTPNYPKTTTKRIDLDALLYMRKGINKGERRRPFKYQSSLKAVAYKIKSKNIKKMLSGIEVRGITSG